MSDIAIRVENLSKMYRIGAREEQPRGLVQAARSLVSSPFAYLQRMRRPPTEEETLWALKDVSFEVKHGEVLGIIGHNGAGKSTLLKILSRITEPSSGEAHVFGRVGSLLEVGTGFHPELTGRENIYLNGAILGMKRSEIERKFDEIVDFSGVEKFLDTPVKRYSSGMYVRLAFAVAAHLDPEILIIDEVLAVGDFEFQKKCLGKMGSVAISGRTVLFVSHNMAAITNLCSRSMLLRHGCISVIGDTNLVVQSYLAHSNALYVANQSGYLESGSSAVRVKIAARGQETMDFIKSGDDLAIIVDIRVDHPLNRPEFGIGVISPGGERIVTFHTRYQFSNTWQIKDKCHCIIDWIGCFLAPGSYTLTAALYDGGQLVAAWENVGSLMIVAGDFFGTGKLPDTSHQGNVLAVAQWKIETF